MQSPEANRARAAKWAAENSQRMRERVAAWAKNNPDKVLAYRVKWYKKNKEKVKARAAKRYAENTEACKETVRNWRLANWDKYLVQGQNRRSRKRKNGGKLSPDIREKLFALQKGKCACCGLSLGDDYHLDHILPLALGGENVDVNVQLLTQKCNIKKSAKHPIDYMQSRGFLL